MVKVLSVIEERKIHYISQILFIYPKFLPQGEEKNQYVQLNFKNQKTTSIKDSLSEK
jgi:hypothetical protein